MELNQSNMARDIAIIKRDIEILKRIFLYEGDLTLWAKRALAKARKASRESYTRLEDLKEEIIAA